MQERRQRQEIIGLDISAIVEEVKDFLRGAWRYRWEAIALAWVGCLVTWWFVLSMPDIYRSVSRVHIDTEDSLQPLLAGMAIETNLLDDVKLILKSIISRPTLEKIAADSGLDLGDLEPAEEESLIRRLREDLVLSLDREQVLEISFEHSNPNVAYAVVDVLIGIFVKDLVGNKRSDTKSAQDFLVKKLEEYEQLLADSEARLAEFKKRNIGQMPGQQGDYYERLQAQMSELQDLDSRIKLTRQRRDALELQMAGEEPVFGVTAGSSQAGAATYPQMAALEAELTQLRLAYTDSHPDVIRVKDLLEKMREEMAARESGASGQALSSLNQNPVYQQMKIQHSQAELELVQLETQRADKARTVANLKNRIDTIPEIEAELTRLNRNYSVYREQHDQLVARLEKARLSEDVEQSSTGLSFNLIDPPSVGSSPVGPNRALFSTAGLIVAIAIGLVFAALRNIASPVFYSSQKLERAFKIPVIGAIKLIQSPQELRRTRAGAALFSVSFVALVGCYALIVLFDQASVNFARQVSDIIG